MACKMYIYDLDRFKIWSRRGVISKRWLRQKLNDDDLKSVSDLIFFFVQIRLRNYIHYKFSLFRHTFIHLYLFVVCDYCILKCIICLDAYNKFKLQLQDYVSYEHACSYLVYIILLWAKRGRSQITMTFVTFHSSL